MADRVVCDFCSAINPTWDYPATTFHDAPLNANSLADWLACDACHTIIEAGNVDALAGRAIRNSANPSIRAMAIHDLPPMLDTARRLYDEFFAHRIGPAYRIGPGTFARVQ